MEATLTQEHEALKRRHMVAWLTTWPLNFSSSSFHRCLKIPCVGQPDQGTGNAKTTHWRSSFAQLRVYMNYKDYKDYKKHTDGILWFYADVPQTAGLHVLHVQPNWQVFLSADKVFAFVSFISIISIRILRKLTKKVARDSWSLVCRPLCQYRF